MFNYGGGFKVMKGFLIHLHGSIHEAEELKSYNLVLDN